MRVLIALALLLNVQFAQAKDSFIVQLKNNQSPILFGVKNGLNLTPIAPQMGLYSASPMKSEGANNVLSTLQHSPDVALIQENHDVEYRRGTLSPNDKFFNKQWNWQSPNSSNGVDAVSAWGNYGTGGKDALGREIVIAVVDGGFDLEQPDLIENLWTNKSEIPGNRVDDDGNGYVDDINGWDIARNSGKISLDMHGTHVAGIMGAKGDNGFLGSGINWNVKIMYVSAGYYLGDTARVMQAYSYILKQKQLWIATNGQQGANVVAVNSSFGLNAANCNSPGYAIWNKMYDEMGKYGILSVGATINAGMDIDRIGDIPTGCSSEYLVTVTSSTPMGVRERNAAYGATTIDLAAPGVQIYSTLPYKRADFMDGTSMAAPHVTGAIGYLYSVGSAAFINKSIASPSEAALEVKRTLLNNVTPQKSLMGQTVSGGILNLESSSEMIANSIGI